MDIELIAVQFVQQFLRTAVETNVAGHQYGYVPVLGILPEVVYDLVRPVFLEHILTVSDGFDHPLRTHYQIRCVYPLLGGHGKPVASHAYADHIDGPLCRIRSLVHLQSQPLFQYGDHFVEGVALFLRPFDEDHGRTCPHGSPDLILVSSGGAGILGDYVLRIDLL